MPLDMVKFMGENQFGFFFVKATFRQTGDQASLTHSDGERCVNAGRVTQPKGMRQVVNTDIPGHFFPQLQQMWIAYRVRTDFQRSVKIQMGQDLQQKCDCESGQPDEKKQGYCRLWNVEGRLRRQKRTQVYVNGLIEQKYRYQPESGTCPGSIAVPQKRQQKKQQRKIHSDKTKQIKSETENIAGGVHAIKQYQQKDVNDAKKRQCQRILKNDNAIARGVGGRFFPAVFDVPGFSERVYQHKAKK